MTVISMKKETKAYGLWDPLVTPADIYSDLIHFLYVFVDEKGLYYWAELRPQDNARFVVVKWNEEGATRDVSPPNSNVRTRVHEYGGRAFTIHDDVLYYSNFDDQRLYKQEIAGDTSPVPVTPERYNDGSIGKYAAPIISPDGNALIFVFEKEFKDSENQNCIGAINLKKQLPQEPIILVSGSDFYADPVLSSDGKQIAWIQWNHPKMPWDESELWHARFNSVKPSVESAEKVAGESNMAICFPSFGPEGKLFFIMDQAGHDEDNPKNWWNIYSYKNGEVEAVTRELAEFGVPLWAIGHNRYVLGTEAIHAICHKREGDFLAHISLETSEISWTRLPYNSLATIRKGAHGNVLLLAGGPDRPPAIITFNTETEETQVLQESYKMPLHLEQISKPTTIEFATQDGGHAFALFYEPLNPTFQPSAGSKPPLIVEVHGGPTGRASDTLSLEKQFWTSMGYAVIDVDHRGSTGYGRKYRDKLLGRWGMIDAKDVSDGIQYLLEHDQVSQKIAIRGGSAGGYAVQRCLTMFPDLFQAGASYFGIGNLITLVKLTHKFESRYLDSLLGASLKEDEGVYKERSPINNLENLRAPMILFQGLDDKIVTPEVSREIVQLLDEKGIKHEYIEYEGEGHGFLKRETLVDALNRESQFYREVFFNM
jgi:dipeptidyl aminopeptidase/acylaminoacyl peptidase